MSKAGQNNQRGIYTQNWVAVSLFLQFLRETNFSYVHLEPNNSEDFDLCFKDGKKVICESKYRNKSFSYAQLKELVGKVIRRGALNHHDEILVVCKYLDQNLKSEMGAIKYFSELKKKYREKGFSKKMIDSLPRIKFWELGPNFDRTLNESLISEYINSWLPPKEINSFSVVLQDKISQLSSFGGVYSLVNFDQDILELKERARQQSDYFNDEINRGKQFRLLEKEIKNKGIRWGTGSVSAFSTRWDLMSFAMDRLKQRRDLELNKWDSLWQLNKVQYFTFGIFDVFENNLNTKENKVYVLQYINRYTKTIRGYFRSDYFDVDVVKIVTKIILDADGSIYIDDAFTVVKDLITFRKKDFFYIRDNNYDHGKWEREEVCKLLRKIYDIAKPELKEKIITLIYSNFDLVEDHDEFYHGAPQEIYALLESWVSEDFKKRLKKIVKIFVKQYEHSYQKYGKTLKFLGWEHSGGGISFSGHHTVNDRHFVGDILTPAIRRYYSENGEAGWRYIKMSCISEVDRVNKSRPDFLNRAVYQIVLDRFNNNDDEVVSREAFGILEEFIVSRKGIPHKSDLIYQAVAGSTLSDDKKWQLVSIATKKFDLPINPFLEIIVIDLAKRQHTDAISELKKWYANQAYYRGFMFELESLNNLKRLFETNFNLAVELFRVFIQSEYFRKSEDKKFGSFDVSELLHEILKKDYSKGLLILKFLENELNLNQNQQIVYTHSLFHDKSDDATYLMGIYTDVVDPLLTKLKNDNKKVVERFSDDVSRTAFVQFASRLAEQKQIAEALRIIRVFISDPDPYMPGEDPNDPEDEYSEHKRILRGDEPNTINSVRGWCGWVLMQCSILEGRKYIPEIIQLTKRLVTDKNYYVVHMGCFALAQLSKTRLSVLPPERKELFFHKNKEQALRMSRDVEIISFDLMERMIKWPVPVQVAMTKSVLHVLEWVRSLNEEDSWRLISQLRQLPYETRAEAAPLFVFFAEFRKNAFTSTKWKWKAPGLYDDLQPSRYNQKRFKLAFVETIKDLQEKNPDDCFRFAASFGHLLREEARGDKVGGYTKLTLEYFELLTEKYGHSIFNLIYSVIEGKLEQKDKYCQSWYGLFLRCLRQEALFYEEQKRVGNIMNVRWYPTLCHSRVLELVDEFFGKDKFMEAAKIIFSFPNEVDLHESEKIISVIASFPKTNKDAEAIIKTLIERNPSKYWDLIKK